MIGLLKKLRVFFLDKYMQLDDEKIKKIVDKLKADSGNDWIPLEGTQAITQVDMTNDANPVFMPASGIVIKAFMNTATGEIRTFSILAVKSD